MRRRIVGPCLIRRPAVRTALSLTFAVAAASVALPATAQQDEDAPTTIEAAVAGLISDAMPAERRPQARRWSDFQRRQDGQMVWGVAPPNVPDGIPQNCVHSRTGWITVRGATAEILACGDLEEIQSISIKVRDLWLGSGDLISALMSRGLSAVLYPSTAAGAPVTSRRDGADAHYHAMLTRYPASRRWRLERPDEAAASLTAEWRCTRPGTRSATRCAMTWILDFDANEPAADETSSPHDPVRLD